jgi:hypothetical protein
LDWALVFRRAEEDVGLHDNSTPINGPEDIAYTAIIDPEQLAKLLTRSSSSRGLHTIVFVDHDDVLTDADGDPVPTKHPLIIMPAMKETEWEWDVMTMVQGRSALQAIMKLPLDCGRDTVVETFKASMKGAL